MKISITSLSERANTCWSSLTSLIVNWEDPELLDLHVETESPSSFAMLDPLYPDLATQYFNISLFTFTNLTHLSYILIN